MFQRIFGQTYYPAPPVPTCDPFPFLSLCCTIIADQDFTEIQRHVKATFTSFKFGVEIIRYFVDGQS